MTNRPDLSHRNFECEFSTQIHTSANENTVCIRGYDWMFCRYWYANCTPKLYDHKS